MSVGLTAKQQEVLRYLEHSIEETGLAPTFDEMREALGYSSKSPLHRHLTCLEQRGYIRRLYGHARAIEILEQAPTSSLRALSDQAFSELQMQVHVEAARRRRAAFAASFRRAA